MTPDPSPDPNPNNPNNLLDTIILLGYNVRIGCTAIHCSSAKFRGGICRFKTFCMRIFALKTFLRLRCSSIHVKMSVLLTYSAGN